MSNVTHGMNIEEVEAFGRRLQDVHAGQIRDLVAEIDRVIGQTSSTWRGPDAERFRSWWPSKKSTMLAMADDLQGFGQSALNNASQQFDASSGRLATAGTATAISRGEGEGDSRTEWSFRTDDDPQGASQFTGFEWKTGAVNGYDEYMVGDDGIAFAQGDYGVRFGFDENGDPVAMAGIDASIAHANLDGTMIGNENLGLTGGIKSELLGAEAGVGVEDGSAGATVGVNFASAGGEIGANVGGAKCLRTR